MGLEGLHRRQLHPHSGGGLVAVLCVLRKLLVARNPGKRLLGLQVITADGGRVSFGKATERHLMKFLSLFCLTIGFMMSGWTKRRQALHDMPCDCLVIRVPVKPFTLLRR
jgi:uncharacterized RDD family membrane protein YckC